MVDFSKLNTVANTGRGRNDESVARAAGTAAILRPDLPAEKIAAYLRGEGVDCKDPYVRTAVGNARAAWEGILAHSDACGGHFVIAGERVTITRVPLNAAPAVPVPVPDKPAESPVAPVTTATLGNNVADLRKTGTK